MSPTSIAFIGNAIAWLISIALIFSPAPKWITAIWLGGTAANLGYIVGKSESGL